MKDCLPKDHGLSEAVLGTPALLPTVDGKSSLTDIQYEALEAGVAKGESSLISAPTSTGKTLIGWWTIASAISTGQRAVYLVSHRALAKQKFEEAQRLFLKNFLGGDRAAIVCATGDGVEDASGRKTNAALTAHILVATYEKFLGCLSVGGPPRDLTDTCFVCDEVQLVGDEHRGQNVELLLTLLRRCGWHQFVGLSAVLSQNDAQALANWLDVRLVRNPKREKALKIECRTPNIVYELITAPNLEGEIQERHLKKEMDTNSIVSELLQKPEHAPVIVFCMTVAATYDLSRNWTAGRPPVEAVDVPSGLDIGPDLVKALTKRAAFHNAEMSEDERLFVEQCLAAGKVDVVYATSTLAAGVNFPLGSAVFASWMRRNFNRNRQEPISGADFQNMAGRVGRMGQDDKDGLVILCANGEAEVKEAHKLMDLTVQDDLGHGITPEDFGALTLQLFAAKLCSTRTDAFSLIASTLSASREVERNSAGVDHWEVDLNRQIDRLVAADCLIEARGQISVTTFGLAVARSGLKPETALYFIEGLVDAGTSLVEMLPTGDSSDREDDLLFVVAHAALASPEFTLEGGKPTRQINWRVGKPGPVPNDYAQRLSSLLFVRPWMSDVSAANGALLVTGWASGQDRKSVEARIPDVRIGTVQTLSRDVAWILTGVSEIVSVTTSPSLADESRPKALRGAGGKIDAVRQLARALRRQAARISAGLPSDVLWMGGLELQWQRRRLSRSQILALRAHQLVHPIDLMNGDENSDKRRREALGSNSDPTLANAVRDAARRWKINDRKYWRKLHQRRAAKVGGEDIVDGLYGSKREQLETAFEAAMSFVSIDCEKLDEKGRQAHPDYLVTIESFRPIVVEIKSKASEAALVSLNAAVEVLGASELIGLASNFCVTVCSPGVEPNVPGIVESCGRLCVVEIPDLVEAILRVREGSLSLEELYNWLTSPGIALIEDLPHPH